METPPRGEKTEKRESLYHLAEERKALKRIANDAGEPPKQREAAKESAKEIAAHARTLIAEEGGIRAAVDRFKREAEHTVDHDLVDEMGPSYKEIATLSRSLDETRDFEMQSMMRLRATRTPHEKNARMRIFDRARTKRVDIEGNLMPLISSHALEYRAFTLMEGMHALDHEGHIVITPSVRDDLDRIGRNMTLGEPMFLHGPTGTGKTSLARFAAAHFTGRSPEMVYCSPQTRESSVWGKTGIRPAKEGGIETVDIYGPLAKAMRDGTAVIFDEFTALPKEQMSFIKGIFNAKPGDRVTVVGNGTQEISPGFQMIFTANLKSEKNPERHDLPPEIAREFEQNNLKIDYPPKEEAYTICLSRLMNHDGSLDLSWHDLNHTLPKLCEAMEEIQRAYAGTMRPEIARLTGSMDASGKTPGLKKLVMTQGTIRAIIENWKIEKKMGVANQSFTAFLDRRLAIGLTFEEYSTADRELAAKILASKGLLRTITPADLGLALDLFSFDAAARLRGDEKAARELTDLSSREAHLTLREIASLDPWNTRRTGALEKAKKYVKKRKKPSVETGPVRTLEAIKKTNETFLKETFALWYPNDTSKIEIDQKPLLIRPQDNMYEQMKNDIDPTKFGEYTVNPETQAIDWENIDPRTLKIEALPALVNKPIYEVARHIMDTYGATHHIPGIELLKWTIEKYNTASPAVQEKYKAFMDGNWYFFFGSLVRVSGGAWRVPHVAWAGSLWYRRAGWLGNGWVAGYRVVLFEK